MSTYFQLTFGFETCSSENLAKKSQKVKILCLAFQVKNEVSEANRDLQLAED